jgi:hypothetical protein
MDPQRRRQSRHIWVAFIILASIGVATTAVSWIINLFYGVQMAPEWWVGFFGNLSTEVFGAILTVWFLEMFIMEPARRRHRLSDDVKASDGVTARRALDELKRLNWIDELKGQDLRNVQWAGADLSSSDLSGTDFTNANLAGINLTSANLARCRFQNANLESAVLERANLENADLSNAYLNHALLENTTLTSASLKGASLENASLTGAKLALAQLDGASFRGAILTGVTGLAAAAGGLSNTILPDGEVYAPGTIDLDRYTDSSRGDAIGPTTT